MGSNPVRAPSKGGIKIKLEMIYFTNLWICDEGLSYMSVIHVKDENFCGLFLIHYAKDLWKIAKIEAKQILTGFTVFNIIYQPSKIQFHVPYFIYIHPDI